MAHRRKFLTGVVTVSTVAFAGCSSVPLIGGGGPEAAVEQYRTASIEGDATTINEVIYENGELPQADEDHLEPVDIEVLEYDITEVSGSEFESQTGEDHNEEAAENAVSETGGSEYAIVRWTEDFVDEEGEEHSFDQYYLLHEINDEWVIIDMIHNA